MFQQIRELLGPLFVQHMRITIDLEVSMMRAINNEFPETIINACKFHLFQCVWRQVQARCLADVYRTNAGIELQVKKLIAISYLPTEDVFIAFSTMGKLLIEDLSQ
jgi:hypothetical protein